MRKNSYQVRLFKITTVFLAAAAALLILWSFLGVTRLHAAPSLTGTGTDPRLRAITITSDLDLYDTAPGDGVDKTVYFDNAMPGVITLTFEISGTPTLSLTAGAAFGDAPQIYTSTTTPWSQVMTYSVETGGEDYAGVTYTAANTASQQSTIVITYIRDVTAPTVAVTAPVYTTETSFDVSWNAADPSPGSGAGSSYKVEYRQDDGDWQAWHDSTSATSDSFTGAEAGHTFTFRVTAHDQVGNSGQGTTETRVGPFRVYLPLVLRQWVWWYQHDLYEPNDTPSQAQAHDPLVFGQVYQAYMWDATDQDDYYHFTPSSTANVQVSLSNIPGGSDYDLYIYYHDDDQYHLEVYSNTTGTADEKVNFDAIQGRKYYVRVYRYSGFNSQQPYHLTATYP